MKHKKNFLLFTLLFISLINSSYGDNLFLPTITEEDQFIEHQNYSLSYSEEHEQAKWVYYELSRNEVEGQYPRQDNFRSDNSVTTGSAELEDYRGSGYDRGHIAPAADMKFSAEAMNESFFLSNMSPQDPSFNRGIWKKLESLVREWAYLYGSIGITSGPFLTRDDYPSIGKNKVSIPDYYYKVILDFTDPELKAIGFILPNAPSSESLESFAVSVDVVEKLSGINFFEALPDEIENQLESQFDLSDWRFENFEPHSPTPSLPELTEDLTINQNQENQETGTYWINSSTNTRHNQNCPYYGNTVHGYYTNEKEGTPCGICGG